MSANQIDYNRGCIKRIEPKSGVEVYMYRDEPGVYYNAYGTPVADTLAKVAGFNVDKYGKEKLKRERMALARETIEAELAGDSTTRNVIKERDGFKIIDIGMERHHLEDPDGNLLTSVSMPKATAMTLLDQLAPEAPKEPEVKAKKTKAQ